jgi:hypothetical protein
MVQCARTWHAHGTSGSIKIGRAGYGRSRGGTLAVDDHVSFRPLRAPGRSGQGSGWFCFAGVVRSRRPKCAPAKGFRQTKPAAPGGPPFFYFFTIGGAPVFGFVISSRAERPSPRPRHADAAAHAGHAAARRRGMGNALATLRLDAGNEGACTCRAGNGPGMPIRS